MPFFNLGPTWAMALTLANWTGLSCGLVVGMILQCVLQTGWTVASSQRTYQLLFRYHDRLQQAGLLPETPHRPSPPSQTA